MKTRQYHYIIFVLVFAMPLLAFIYTIQPWRKDNSDDGGDGRLKARIDYLLRDARELSTYIPNQKANGCTEKYSQLLEHEVLKHPHIQGIYLYHDGVIYCSSLRERFVLNSGFSEAVYEATDGHVTLLNKLDEFPGKVFLAYIKGNQSSGLVITIDAYWLRKWFAADGRNGIIIDGKLLSKDLSIVDAESVWSEITHRVDSTLADISVVSFRHNEWITLLWPAMIVLVLFVGVFIALLMRMNRKGKLPNQRQLEMAILSGEIAPWYQPIMNCANGEIYGAEVLARWRTEEGKMISPEIFIPLAERAGMLVTLTTRLLEQVERDLMVLKLRCG